MGYLVLTKIKGNEDDPRELVVTSYKPYKTEESAIKQAAKLTESFYDIKIVEIVREYEDALEIKATKRALR